MNKLNNSIRGAVDLIAPISALGGIAMALAGYALAPGQNSASDALTAVTPPAHFNHDLTQVRQTVVAYANGQCSRGHQVHMSETATEMTLYALACSASPNARHSIEVKVPLCLSSSSLTAHNIDAGFSFFRYESEHARQSYERNQAGYAAYARKDTADPVYLPCS